MLEHQQHDPIADSYALQAFAFFERLFALPP